MTRKCTFSFCKRQMDSKHLMCRHHWLMVPAKIRADIQRHWKARLRDHADTEAIAGYRKAVYEAFKTIYDKKAEA